MRQRIGFLKKAIARVDGYYSRSGERLVSARLTPDEVAAFNTHLIPKKPAAAPAKAKPVVAVKTPRAPKVKAAPVVKVVTEQEAVAEVVVEEVAAAAAVEEEQKAE